MTPEEEVAALRAETAEQREQIATLLEQNALLVERVRELEARLAKDSHNSGKPPSSDGLKRQLPRTRSLRRASGRRTGGQVGRPGKTLCLVSEPDVVEEHHPPVCAACQGMLDETAEVVGVVERRQVYDLPPVRLWVTEHRALRLRCPTCQRLSDGVFPAEASSRAQDGPRLRARAVYLVEQQLLPYDRTCEVLAEVYGASVSEGALDAWIQQSAAVLAPVEAAIKTALGQAPILHHDETGVRRVGKLAWAHVTCTDQLTHYAIHAQRGSAATDAIGILPPYQGVSVHDGWKPYQTYSQCRHALCNVHHLRELTYLEEQYGQAWASEMKTLLHAMQAATDAARDHGARPRRDPPRRCPTRGLRLPLGDAARQRPGCQPTAAPTAWATRTAEAVTRPQSARTAVAPASASAGLPRRSVDSLRQQPGRTRRADAPDPAESGGLFSLRGRRGGIRAYSRLPLDTP